MSNNTIDVPVGYEKITGLAAAKGLTPPNAIANVAQIVVEGQPVRIRDDGTDPTAAEGLPWAVDVPHEYRGDLSKLKLIEVAASSTVFVNYYKRAKNRP